MVKLTIIEAGGDKHEVNAEAGESLMESAVRNGVPSIAADCGGVCACATCRVYVSEEWREKTGQPSDMELEMLEFSGDTTPGIRLSCQISLTPELDGLVVRTPESQH